MKPAENRNKENVTERRASETKKEAVDCTASSSFRKFISRNLEIKQSYILASWVRVTLEAFMPSFA
jgi:hypothetical protein